MGGRRRRGTAAGRGRCAPTLLAGRVAPRLRVRPRTRGAALAPGRRPRARRDPGLGRGHPLVARRNAPARARRRPRGRPCRRAVGDQDPGGGRGATGPEGLPARAVLAAPLARRRGNRRHPRRHARGRQRLRGRLGRREGRRGLHGRAVGERLVRRVGRPDRPRRARGRARPHAEVAAAVAADLAGWAGRVRRGLLVRPRHACRHGPRARPRADCAGAARDVDRVRRRGHPLGRGLPRRRHVRRPALARRLLRGARGRRVHARASILACTRGQRGRLARRRRPARAPTRRPRSCSGRTASGGR